MVSRISQSTNRLTTVAEIRLEQQKTEKISSLLRTGERKDWTIFARTDNPDPEPELLPSFEQTAA
jgi:hypothetical protein